MSTNFYWTPTDGEAIHIGKSSMGWAFLFQGSVHRSWEEWLDEITPGKNDAGFEKGFPDKGDIIDEYCRKWDFISFYNVVVHRRVTSQKAVHGNHDKDTWLDKKGHIFNSYEFS